MLIRRPPDSQLKNHRRVALLEPPRLHQEGNRPGRGYADLLPPTHPGLGTVGDDKLTPYENVTGYNNYYELGTDKGNPKVNSTHFRTKP